MTKLVISGTIGQKAKGDFMYKIVFIDIDGTLVNKEKVISDPTKKAIKKLQDKGIEIVLATGRPPFHFQEIAGDLDISSFVSYNGTYMVHEGKVIQKYPLKREYLQTLVQRAKQYNHPLVFSGMDQAVCNVKDHPDVNHTFTELKLHYTPAFNPDYWEQEDIYQVVLYCQEDEEELYTQSVTDLSFVRYHELAMDVMPKGLSKAHGIRDMLRHLNLTPQEAVAFGDGLNDREMLEYVGMGVAMGNAHPDLIPHADMVTKTVDEDGLAYGLKCLGMAE